MLAFRHPLQLTKSPNLFAKKARNLSKVPSFFSSIEILIDINETKT